jgi:serine/threonine-protein kinase
MSLARDTRLGRYVIRAPIGVGGMGAVYRAFDTVLQRQVAIKTILSHKNSDGEYLKRFRREALAISQLEDPHIVKLLDFVEGNQALGEPPYMVMELLRGEDLQSIIARGPMPVERAVDILLEICAAVGACHRHGFVHRDLKGTNVFVTEYNAVETAKVLDFGVAKVWNEEAVAEIADASEVTQQGITIGTPAYLAPEILRGGAATPATDQYALGILLYSALTGGRKPFEVKKKNEFRELNLMRAILEGEHPRVRTYREDLPEGLEEVIERAIEREADRRFSSVHSMGEALLKWASPRACLQWTGHFTKAPPRPVSAHESIVGSDGTRLQDPGGTAIDLIRAPAAARTQPTTRQIETGELRAALSMEGAPQLPTTATWDAGAEDGVPSGIPVIREQGNLEAVAIHLEPRDAGAKSSSPTVSARPRRRRRASLLLGAAAVAVVAIVAAFSIPGATRVPAPPPQVRVEVPPRTPAPVVTAAALAATSPEGAPSAPAAPPEAAAPPEVAPTKVHEPEKKAKPKRHRRTDVDENGIGIPTN